MAQGPRRGWVRAAFTGLGALLCAGAIGCTGLDKPAPPKIGSNTGTGVGTNGKQVPPGLPGTTMLPGSSTTGTGMGMGASRTPQTGFGNPATGMGNSGVMQTGGTNYPATGTMGAPTGGSFNGQSGRPPVGGYNPNSGSGTGYGPAGGGSLVPNAGPVGAAGGSGGLQQGYNTTSGSGFNPPAPGLGNLEPPPPPGGYGAGGPIPPPQTPPYLGNGGFGSN